MSHTARRTMAECWARQALDWPEAGFEPASADASFRNYYRISHGSQSFIVMDAPPPQEDVTPFIDIAVRLRRAGVHVPAIAAKDRERGFLLLEDLGTDPFHTVLNDQNADALFGDAMRALTAIQVRADPSGLPVYDAERLRSEMALFTEWFLARHWRVELSADELADWDRLGDLLVDSALNQAQVFCHRDYMPRNLMISEPNPGIIDFQDAVLGPISYDPVSLFRDAFLSWPQERVDTWLESYRQSGRAVGLPLPESAEQWRKDCDLMGMQRHLKVIGIFARICYRDGKPQYLEDAPRFFRYLDFAIARNPELAALGSLINTWRNRQKAST